MSELYVLTDPILTPEKSLKNSVYELFSAGVKYVQWRDKRIKESGFAPDFGLLKELSAMADDFGAYFIINDSAQIALKVGAQGVHLGDGDGEIRRARELLGAGAIIGASCYRSIKLAQKAADEGASYVAFAAMFASPTKPSEPLCDHDIIREAKGILTAPICVIGGINEDNLRQIRPLKPDLIAIVSAAYKNGDIAGNIRRLNAILAGAEADAAFGSVYGSAPAAATVTASDATPSATSDAAKTPSQCHCEGGEADRGNLRASTASTAFSRVGVATASDNNSSAHATSVSENNSSARVATTSQIAAVPHATATQTPIQCHCDEGGSPSQCHCEGGEADRGNLRASTASTAFDSIRVATASETVAASPDRLGGRLPRSACGYARNDTSEVTASQNHTQNQTTSLHSTTPNTTSQTLASDSAKTTPASPHTNTPNAATDAVTDAPSDSAKHGK